MSETISLFRRAELAAGVSSATAWEIQRLIADLTLAEMRLDEARDILTEVDMLADYAHDWDECEAIADHDDEKSVCTCGAYENNSVLANIRAYNRKVTNET